MIPIEQTDITIGHGDNLREYPGDPRGHGDKTIGHGDNPGK